MSIMKQITIKTIQETIGVSDNLAGKYLRGAARPTFENIYKLNKTLKIPFYVWLSSDAQYSYFNDTKQKSK